MIDPQHMIKEKEEKMKKYQVMINETITSEVIIYADSIEEARDRINTGHFNKLKQIKKTTPKIESCYLHEDEIPKELRAIRFA